MPRLREICPLDPCVRCQQNILEATRLVSTQTGLSPQEEKLEVIKSRDRMFSQKRDGREKCRKCGDLNLALEITRPPILRKKRI